MKLIFATNNLHKLSEIKCLIRSNIHISGLDEAGFKGDIPEDFTTLEQNASQKAWYIYNRLHGNCFADDTGLEVDVLKGQPGVFSARFSRVGDLRYPEMDVTEGNIKKLLELMNDQINRKARFRTVISLIIDGVEYQFEGIVYGQIARQKSGTNGFGYDPVFIPDGESCCFAEMDMERKNLISHRGRAIAKLVDFLNSPDFSEKTLLEGDC